MYDKDLTGSAGATPADPGEALSGAAQRDAASRGETASLPPGKVVPTLGATAHFSRLLSGLIEKHGGHLKDSEGVFDFFESLRRTRARLAFVSLHRLLDWNHAGMTRLKSIPGTSGVRIVPFSESLQRSELPDAPGLEREDALCVPLSINRLEAIIQRELS